MRALIICAMCVAACDTPTTGVVVNGFTDDTDVNRVWWSTTLFPDAIAAGETSSEQRVIPAGDEAYALLSRDGGLIAVKSVTEWQVTRGEVLSIEISPSTVVGDCAAGSALSAEDAELVTVRLFPAQFAGGTYDPVTCTLTPNTGP